MRAIYVLPKGSVFDSTQYIISMYELISTHVS